VTPGAATPPPPRLWKTTVPPATGEYQWVYLWQWPIRTMHWLAALSIVVLAATGLYIGRPYFMPSGDTSDHFLMGWVRFLHFAAAAILVATAIVRCYWLLAGNRYERLAALFPVRPRDWVNMYRQVKYYLMIQPEKAPHYLGHNPLAQLGYTTVYGLALLQVVTGFALYGQANPGGLFYTAFGWIAPLFGGLPVVRFLTFIPIHIYMATRADLLERGGVISSIITGGRFVPREQHFIDE
jgi:Ni/Fe-hydrogenase 1 B-type cytochrome subunit